MIKNLIVICILLAGFSVYAQEIPVTITPVEKVTTGNKNLHEGDTIDFKDINTGEIVTGTIKELIPNGFEGKQATLFIDTFKYKNSDKILSGNLYLQGGAHKKVQEFANNSEFGVTSVFIRGGEVILKPNKTTLVVFLNDYINSEDMPIKIKPAQNISTTEDELEVGDSIRFSVVKDVYKNGKLYIKKDSIICGFIDYLSDNGWAFDNAQIDIKYFKVKNVDGKLLTIESPISINGFDILKYKGNRPAQFFNYCGVIFRGKEVNLNPQKDNAIFNIWVK